MTALLAILGAVVVAQLVAILLLARALLSFWAGQSRHVENLQHIAISKNLYDIERLERTAQRPELADAKARHAEASARIVAEGMADLETMLGAREADARPRPVGMPSGLDGT